MQLKLLHGFTTLLLFASFLPSCQRELSCDGCKPNNQAPISNAGKDQTITLPRDSALLDGSLSTDPDGKISTWQWTKVAGPASFNLINNKAAKTIVKNLTAGIYQFELKVTDDQGASATDTVMITVEAASTANHPPIANAGNDTTIVLPGNTVNLNGSLSSDPDNNITGYLWTKISGPSFFNITNANFVQTQATNLVQGVYLFELKVTDAGALSDRDTIQVTVTVNPIPACTNCKIVFVSDRDGNVDIYSCNADGSNISRLTTDAGTDDQPAWSPDRSHIAFVSNRTGSAEIYIMNADGSNVLRRTFSQSNSHNPAWSPDGTRIAYSTVSNGSANIWVAGAVSGSPSLLFERPGVEFDPSWSPDGTKLVLVSDMQAIDFETHVYTINSDGTNVTALTSGRIFDHIYYRYPRWSPSGMSVAVSITEFSNSNMFSNAKVGVMNPSGSGLTALILSGAARYSTTSWSADGTRIAYTSLSGSRKDISWVSANGSTSGTIVTNGWDADWQH